MQLCIHIFIQLFNFLTENHFDQRELDELKKELLHHQNELNEYNALAEELYGTGITPFFVLH